MTKQEQYRLITLYQNTQDKKHLNELIEGNSGLILKITSQFAIKVTRKVVSNIDDFRQIATIGFIKGINGFDCSRGLALSTYCVPWMRHELWYQYWTTAGELIKLPVSTAKSGDYTAKNYLTEVVTEDGETVDIMEVVADSGNMPFDQQVYNSQVFDMVQNLDPNQARAISMRFGLGHYNSPHTVKQVTEMIKSGSNEATMKVIKLGLKSLFDRLT